MKLRYFQVYDEYGKNGSVELQYWDEEENRWCTIPFVRVSYREEEVAMKDKNYL